MALILGQTNLDAVRDSVSWQDIDDWRFTAIFMHKVG